MPELTLNETEQKAVDEYKLAESVYNAACDRMEATFRLRIEALIDRSLFSEAREYIIQMPESTAKLCLADYFRVKRGDYDK